jgi:hypothetical protein
LDLLGRPLSIGGGGHHPWGVAFVSFQKYEYPTETLGRLFTPGRG